MLSYQHSYHAGCFADVMKHALLARILDYLIQKDKPLFYLDTHAGRGLYDLQHEHALKIKEAVKGIQAVWPERYELSPLFSPYFEAVEALNTEDLRYYPGSSYLATFLLRRQDRLVLCELHPQEFECLRQMPKEDNAIFFKKEDGLKNMKSLLPPAERRGLVFIDPSYECKTEYHEVTEAIRQAYKRAPIMTYVLWYPLLKNQLPEGFIDNLKKIAPENSARFEFYATTEPISGMTGSGLWVINPPYTLIDEGKKMLKELTKFIEPKQSAFRVDV